MELSVLLLEMGSIHIEDLSLIIHIHEMLEILMINNPLMVIIIQRDLGKVICLFQIDMDATTVVNLIIGNQIAVMIIRLGVMCATH